MRSLFARSPPNCVTSMPAQNALPAPVRTTQRTSSSRVCASRTSASSSRRSSDSALRLSGRLSVTRATPSAGRSTSTSMRGTFAVVAPARFDHHTLTRLADADEIEMRTPRGDGTPTSRPIWVVVVDGAAYVRSYAGERGAWYRRARADGRADVRVGCANYSVRAV